MCPSCSEDHPKPQPQCVRQGHMKEDGSTLFTRIAFKDGIQQDFIMMEFLHSKAIETKQPQAKHI